MAALVLKTAPTVEPVSVSEVRLHSRIDNQGEDSLIESLIKAAREHVEALTKTALITQTYTLKLDYFLSCMVLPMAPLQSVTSVKYIDSDDVNQTVDTSVYTVDTDSNPGRIYLAYGQSWPIPKSIQHPITIEYITGYGDEGADIPESLRLAIMLLVGHFYENREETSVVSLNRLPLGVNALVSPYTNDIF